jgi:hypothetical protein
VLFIAYIADVVANPGSDTIKTIVGAVVAIATGYFINVWQVKQKGKNEIELKKLDAKDVADDLQKALDKIAEMEILLQKERDLRKEIEKKYAEIKMAFNTALITFELVVGDNEEAKRALQKIKEFIQR